MYDPTHNWGHLSRTKLVASADPSFGPGVRMACLCQAGSELSSKQRELQHRGFSPSGPSGCPASDLVLLTESPSLPSSFFHPVACKAPCTSVGGLLLELCVVTFLGAFLSPFLSPEPLVHVQVISLLTYFKIWSVPVCRNVRIHPWQGSNLFCVLCVLPAEITRYEQ